MSTAWRPIACTVCVLVIAVGGCGKQPLPATTRAENVLEKFLDAWTKGATASNWSSNPDPIQVTDPDWKAGCRLLGFLILDSKEEERIPGIVHCRATLSLREPKGKKVDKEVQYDVESEPLPSIKRVGR